MNLSFLTTNLFYGDVVTDVIDEIAEFILKIFWIIVVLVIVVSLAIAFFNELWNSGPLGPVLALLLLVAIGSLILRTIRELFG